MALESSTAPILEDGVLFLEDPDIGTRVDEFDKKGFPFQREEGLDFCRESTLDDARIRDVIESLFEWSGLGLLKAYGPNPSLVYSFLNNTPEEVKKEADKGNKGKDKVKVLVVQLFSSNSRMVFYKRSHLYPLRAKQAKIGLLDVPQESLERDEIEPFQVDMKKGGFAIIDGRLGFKMLQGVTIMAGFAVEEELKFWSKMRLPKTANLMRKIKEMESAKIGMNVEFIELGLEEGRRSITSTTQPA